LIETKVKKIFKNLDEKADAIIIKNSIEPFIDNNFFYATELKQGLFEGCVAVLYPDGKITAIVSQLESESALKSDLDVKVYRTGEEFKNKLMDCLKNSINIGVDFSSLIYRDLLFLKKFCSNSKFIDASEAIMKTRSVKTTDEINLILKAIGIAESVMIRIPDIVREEMKEFELAAEIDYLMQKNGADKTAFDTISSFGENSSQPHYTKGNKTLKHGDFILCDFGACYNKYNSDLTRTFVFKEANDKQKKMHEVVYKAQKLAFGMIKPGVMGKEIHLAVEEYINTTEFAGCFIHGTGHSLGINVHDGFVSFGPNSEIKLEENMVLTVEPGVYIPGFGGVRIEDDIVVTSEGCRILSKTTRDLIEII